MAVRTTPPLVQGILGKNYDGEALLTPYIATAGSVVDRVAACAAKKGLAISGMDLELMERWLAAHYYTKMDPVYSSQSDGRASGTFVRNPKEPEPYKDAAVSLDSTGCLAAILERRTASVTWAGKAPSERIDFINRD